MRLAEFIRAHPHEIEQQWQDFAKTLKSSVMGLSDFTLRDHVREILKAIADDIELARSPIQQVEKSEGGAVEEKALDRVARVHSDMRLDLGFDVEHIIAEYRGLRAGILRLWSRQPLSQDDKNIDDVARFNETIDEAIAEVVRRHANRTIRYSDRFVAILAHDIRGPLNLISLAGSALQRGAPLDAPQKRQVSRIMQGVKRISRLIDDLAILVRSRVGSPVPLAKAIVDLGPICQQALEEVKASHQHVSFELQSAGNLSGHWDSERLAQVISNLTSNAVIHAAAPTVRVSIQDQDDDVLLEVSNHGVPIPAEMQESIFEPLVHQGGSSGSLSSGLGLGLFIVREIVTAHGGRVTVMSDESSGTTFTVRLPRVHSG